MSVTVGSIKTYICNLCHFVARTILYLKYQTFSFEGSALSLKKFEKEFDVVFEKITYFSSFSEFRKGLIDHVESHIVLHEKIEQSELNNFSMSNSSLNCTLNVIEI